MHFYLINYVPIDPRKSKWALKQLFLVKYWTSSLTGKIDCRKQFVSSQDKMLILRICREQNMTTSSTLLRFINSGKLCLIIMEVSQPSCWTWKLWDSTCSCSSIYMSFSFLFYFFGVNFYCLTKNFPCRNYMDRPQLTPLWTNGVETDCFAVLSENGRHRHVR